MVGFPKRENKTGDKAKRPKPGVPLNKDVIAQLIVKHKGNVSRVADAIGSQRGVIRGVIDRNPDLIQLLADQRERQIDELEKSCWDDAIEHRDTALRCFLLKTQARGRGYDQDEAKNAAKDIATAAFDFIIQKTKDESK